MVGGCVSEAGCIHAIVQLGRRLAATEEGGHVGWTSGGQSKVGWVLGARDDVVVGCGSLLP